MKIFKFILLLFLASFIYHFSMLLAENGCHLIGLDKHAWIHICFVLSFFCYKAIIKKKPPEEKS